MASVLVVEDEMIVGLDIERTLSKLGYEVPAVVGAGEEALAEVTRSCPDLVLMDILLAGPMDGIEAACALRERFDVPVVYLSANTDERTLQRASRAEPYGFLTKPFGEKELRSAIEVALHTHQLRRRLRESEARYRQIVETTSEGIWILDVSGYATFVNAQLCRLLGFEPARLSAHSPAEFVEPGHRDIVTRVLAQSRRGYSERFEACARHANGAMLHLAISASPVFDASGGWQGTLFMVSDVTERYHEEEALTRNLVAMVPPSAAGRSAQVEEEGVVSSQRFDLLRTTTARLVALLQNLQAGILVESDARRVQMVNQDFCDLFRLSASPTELLGADCDDVFNRLHPVLHDPVAFAQRVTFLLAHEQTVTNDLVHLADGRAFERDYVPVYVGNRHEGNLWVYRDVTEREAASAKLQRRNETVRLLHAMATAANNAQAGAEVLKVCLRHVCAYMNWSVGHAYVEAHGELVPTNVWHVQTPEKYEWFQTATETSRLQAGQDLVGVVYASGRPAFLQNLADSSRFVRAQAACQVGLQSGFAFPVLVGTESVYVLEFFSEREQSLDTETLEVMANVGALLGRVVERERTQQLLEQHAEAMKQASVLDELTGLYNRRGFLELAQRQVKLADRSGRPLALFFLDLNEMKAINDTLGHEFGDVALRDLAQLLRSTFRATDLMARLGGDEFVVLALETRSPGVTALQDRFLAMVYDFNTKGERPFRLSVSVGIAYYDPEHPMTIEALLAVADDLMYEQKRKKNKTVPCHAELAGPNQGPNR